VDDGAAMSRVAFARLSDAPPPVREILDVEDDGSWTVWRSVGLAIGRFAGSGEAASGAGKRIIALAAAAEADEPPADGNFPPDATVDSIDLGGRSVSVPYRETVGGSWGELLAACRGLLDEALEHPRAAIGLVVAGPDRVRLEHRGEEPLPIELGSAQVEATVWADGVFVAAGTGRIKSGRLDAGPGWSLDVQLEGIDPSAKGEAVTFVSFVADDGGVYIPVVLSAGRAPS
jgi:hypothetical protein